MATAEQRFEADKKFAYRALQDARQYVTDFDRSGSKAEALYERLARASGMMRPWSTDGTSAQSKKAIEYLNEITSILSEKIGPAARREFSEQGGTRHHATKKSAEHEHDPVGHTRGVRAREIVRLAAEQVKDPSTRYWLLADERGTFEKAARKYLEETADKARALGMPNEKVNEEIAVMLALSAVEAFLKRTRKGR